MDLVDGAGFLAGIFVVLAFYSTNATSLRGFAIASNVLFVVYAVDRNLLPIATLHLVLLPLNIRRLRQALEVTPAPRGLA